MNFDFSKFTTIGTEVENAFGNNKTEEVLGSIAKEIESSNKEEVKSDVVSLSDEQVKKNLEFLKEQKEKAKSKTTEVEVDSKDKNSKSAKSSGKGKEKVEKKEEPVVYSRPRKVIAYGELVYTEEDVNATLDNIREKLVKTYGYSEFKNKEKCQMRFDAKTGEVYPHIQFNKKG